MKQYFQLLFLL